MCVCRCSTPSEFAGKQVNTLEPEHMVCVPPPFAATIVHSAKFIMYVTFAIVLIVVAIAGYTMYNGRLARHFPTNDTCVCAGGVLCHRTLATPNVFGRFGQQGARANAASMADPSFDYRSLVCARRVIMSYFQRMNADDDDPKHAAKKDDNDSDGEPSFV